MVNDMTGRDIPMRGRLSAMLHRRNGIACSTLTGGENR